MSGNASQMTQDAYGKYDEKSPKNGGAVEGDDSSQRVIRGGDWQAIPYTVRSAFRTSQSSNWYDNETGFRVARVVDKDEKLD